MLFIHWLWDGCILNKTLYKKNEILRFSPSMNFPKEFCRANKKSDLLIFKTFTDNLFCTNISSSFKPLLKAFVLLFYQHTTFFFLCWLELTGAFAKTFFTPSTKFIWKKKHEPCALFQLFLGVNTIVKLTTFTSAPPPKKNIILDLFRLFVIP